MPIRLSVLIGALVLVVGGVLSNDVAAGGSSVRQDAEADAATTVALVSNEGWLGIGRLSMASERASDVPGSGTVVFMPTAGRNQTGRVVFATLANERLPPQEPPVPTVRVGNLDGYHGVDPHSGHTWLMAGRGARHVNLWSGPDVSIDELMALAASLDLSRPLELQKPEPWRVMTWSAAALNGGTVRAFQTSSAERSADLHVATYSAVDERAMWLLGSATVADVGQVRGRLGLVAEDTSGDSVTLTWLEAPGVVVQMTYRAVSDELVADAVDAAADLVAVDGAGWDEFADLAAVRAVPPPPPDPESLPRLVVVSQLPDGRTYAIEERRDAILCARVDGVPALERCDTNPRRWRGWSESEMPRLVDPGDLAGSRSPVLVYGYLPDRLLGGDYGRAQEAIGRGLSVGRAVAVEVSDTRGRYLGAGTLFGHIWALYIPDVELGLEVTFTFIDGSQEIIVPGPGRGDGEGVALAE